MAVVEKTCDIGACDDTVGIGGKECFRGDGKAFALQGSHYFFIARVAAAAEFICFLNEERVLRVDVETDNVDFFSAAGSGGQLVFRGKLDAGNQYDAAGSCGGCGLFGAVCGIVICECEG